MYIILPFCKIVISIFHLLLIFATVIHQAFIDRGNKRSRRNDRQPITHDVLKIKFAIKRIHKNKFCLRCYVLKF